MSDQPYPAFVMYGIKNCDTIKKARLWLDDKGIAFQFHDYRTDGIDDQLLNQFIQHLDWELLVNKRGTTWRKLSDEQKAAVKDAESAKAVLLAEPAMIKRPILVSSDGRYLLGFSDSDYQQFTA